MAEGGAGVKRQVLIDGRAVFMGDGIVRAHEARDVGQGRQTVRAALADVDAGGGRRIEGIRFHRTSIDVHAKNGLAAHGHGDGGKAADKGGRNAVAHSGDEQCFHGRRIGQADDGAVVIDAKVEVAARGVGQGDECLQETSVIRWAFAKKRHSQGFARRDWRHRFHRPIYRKWRRF